MFILVSSAMFSLFHVGYFNLLISSIFVVPGEASSPLVVVARSRGCREWTKATESLALRAPQQRSYSEVHGSLATLFPRTTLVESVESVERC